MARKNLAVVYVCLCCLLLDAALASILLEDTNMNAEMAEAARGIVAGSYLHHSYLPDKLRYIQRRMNATYGFCKWNVIGNPGAHRFTSTYWAYVAGRHDLFWWTDFYIFSTDCKDKV